MSDLTINLNNVQPLDSILTELSELSLSGNANKYLRVTAGADGFEFATVSGGGTWGSITGTLSDQTDLQNALNAKLSLNSILTELSELSLSGNALKHIRVNAGADGFEFATVSGGGTWGSITGTLSDQTDLQNALNAKLSLNSILTELSELSLSGNALKHIRVNAGADGFEFATVSGGGTWGSITGTLSDQTDLQNALNAKLSLNSILTELSELSLSGNALKHIRVNAGADGFEFATVSGGGTWGSITGTLSDQTDLQNALNAKLSLTGGTLTGNLSLGANQLTVANIRANGSGGLLLENNNGDDVLLLGAGSGQGATFYGGVNVAGNFTVDTNVFYVDTTNDAVAISDTPVSGRKLQIKGSAVTDKLLVLKSVSSQTGNHWESRHSDDTIQSKVRYNGNFVLGGDFNEYNGNRETLLTLVPGVQGLNAIAITDGGNQYTLLRKNDWYTSENLRISSYQTSPYTQLLIGQNGVSIGKDSVSAASASLHVFGRKTDQVTVKFQAIASQTTAIFQALNSAGTRLIEFTYNGGVIFAEMLDGSAANSTMYYSLTSNKLVYKNSGGTVNALY